MKSTHSNANPMSTPNYSITQIMDLLDINEPALRKMITKAGINIDESIIDPSETILYEDLRRLWLSVANRYEGKLLAKLLIEKHENWYSRLFNIGR